jgi:hypothetical protein
LSAEIQSLTSRKALKKRRIYKHSACVSKSKKGVRMKYQHIIFGAHFIFKYKIR